jgi:hypothetical protein
MPSPPDPLVQPAQLSRFGVPADFVGKFALRPFQVQILVGGALGTMQFVWRYAGDTDWSNTPIVSTGGTSWAYTLDDVFADLVFAAAAYVALTVYAVDASGAVTGGAGELAATRFSLPVNACSAATMESLTLMRDAVTQPLLSWGDDVRTHAAAMVHAILKRGRGATPPGGGMGDENIWIAETNARRFFLGIGERGKPDSITDSSPTLDGPMFSVYPEGDDPIGW